MSDSNKPMWCEADKTPEQRWFKAGYDEGYAAGVAAERERLNNSPEMREVLKELALRGKGHDGILAQSAICIHRAKTHERQLASAVVEAAKTVRQFYGGPYSDCDKPPSIRIFDEAIAEWEKGAGNGNA